MRGTSIAILVLLMSGCAATHHSSSSQTPGTTRETPEFHVSSHAGERIAEHALTMVGTPYRYGGSTPETGFDCSGLVYFSFTQSGVRIPRTSQEQFRASQKISLNDARRGDLLFFEDQEKLSHVGIYVGDGQFVHAPSSGRTVTVANLASPYYQMHLVGVGRLIHLN